MKIKLNEGVFRPCVVEIVFETPEDIQAFYDDWYESSPFDATDIGDGLYSILNDNGYLERCRG